MRTLFCHRTAGCAKLAGERNGGTYRSLAAVAFTKKADAEFQLDFDDALHYATAKKHTFTLVSFDQDFDRTDLARTTPADILSRYENNDSANRLR
jgi:uncharacterized protein with PIN domain